jgi:hypothetical protein
MAGLQTLAKQFEQKNLKLWLPLEAPIYLDVNGKRFRHRHTYIFRGLGPETGRSEVACAPIQESGIHIRDRVHRRASSLPVIN